MYASRALDPFSPAQLGELTRNSAERNAFRDISGALLYTGGCFLQLLEGSDWGVRELFEKIARDPRHRDVHELSCRRILDRDFSAWGMACLHEDATEAGARRKLQRIAEHANSTINFDALGESAHRLMKELKEAIDRQSSLAGVLRAA
jgi:hypothetical protein